MRPPELEDERKAAAVCLGGSMSGSRGGAVVQSHRVRVGLQQAIDFMLNNPPSSAQPAAVAVDPSVPPASSGRQPTAAVSPLRPLSELDQEEDLGGRGLGEEKVGKSKQGRHVGTSKMSAEDDVFSDVDGGRQPGDRPEMRKTKIGKQKQAVAKESATSALSDLGQSRDDAILIESQDPDESPDDQLVEHDGTTTSCGGGGTAGVDVAPQHQDAGSSSGVGAAARSGERKQPTTS